MSAALLSVLALVQKSAKLFSAAIRLQDPKFDQLYYEMLAEKKRTEEWASHMRVFNNTNLHATLPSEGYDAVGIHFRKMDLSYEKTQEKFSTIEDVRKSPVNPTALKAGTKSLPHS